MVNSYEIWEDSVDQIFYFDSVAEHFAGTTPEEVLKLLVQEPERNTFGPLSIIRTEDVSFFRTETGQAFSFYNYPRAHDLTSFGTFELICYPVYYNSKFDEILASDGLDLELYKVRWVESQSAVETLSTGKTDFYEKNGWWPHLELTDGSYAPMIYIADVLVDGEIGSIFEDFDSDFAASNMRPKAEWNIREEDPVILFQNRLRVPDYVHKLPIAEAALVALAKGGEEYSSFSHKLVPLDTLPKFAKGCQDDYTPDAPHNIVLYHFPATWFGAEPTEQEGIYRIDAGDCGTFLLAWDGNWNFKLKYQQT